MNQPSFSGTHVEQCFLEAFARTVSVMVDEPQVLEAINGFITSTIGAMVPVAAFQDNALMALTDRVFGDAGMRDFILRVSNHFLLRLLDHPDGRKNYDTLVSNLAFAIDAHTSYGSTMAAKATGGSVGAGEIIPAEVAQDMQSVDYITSTLMGNKWLVTVMMIFFYVPMPDPPEAPRQPRQAIPSPT